MLAFLSPAKNMRPCAAPAAALTAPVFEERAAALARLLREYSPWQLESLLKVNPALALKAFDAYAAFDTAAPSPALLTYYGLAFQHMDPASFTAEDLAFAQEHVRILSALYGLLRPLDGIRPYRLEMQAPFRVEGRSLYAYWDDGPARALLAQGGPVINLASAEYANLILPHLAPGERCVTCSFLTWRRGKLVMPATAATMARGRMVRFLVRNRLDDPEGLKAFDWDDYAFAPELSTDSRYVFTRGEESACL